MDGDYYDISTLEYEIIDALSPTLELYDEYWNIANTLDTEFIYHVRLMLEDAIWQQRKSL